MNNTFIWLSFALLLPCSPNYTSSFSNIKSYRNKKGQNISKQITSNIERLEYQLAAANSPAGSSSKQPILSGSSQQQTAQQLGMSYSYMTTSPSSPQKKKTTSPSTKIIPSRLAPASTSEQLGTSIAD